MQTETTSQRGVRLPLMDALRMFYETIQRGKPEAGPWIAPKDGTLKAEWMPKLGAYRFTIDLIAPSASKESSTF